MGEEIRANPELLLRQIQEEENRKKNASKGKLCIFLGYAAGVGKTYTMLEAAHALQKEGVDVVAGYIEPHDRPETKQMEEGLEKVESLMVEYKGIKLRELDLDGVLKRHPKIALIDELAHTNAPGMRHQKRYEDIEEILQAGIDVYTTVNIQHLESLNDIVGNITGIRVKERIPDRVFDQATQVKLVDIEPDILIERLQEGKVYKAQQAERALNNFFAKEKLIALRELALRRTADKVNKVAREEKQLGKEGGYYSGEHILTCISTAPSCEKVIRSASRLAYAFHARFTALYVETPALQNADPAVKKIRDENIHLAEVLGAKVVTVFGEDIAFQIGEYARISGVSKIVLGRTNHRILFGQRRGTLTDQINQYTPNIDVYIIPDERNGKKTWIFPWKRKVGLHKKQESVVKELAKAAGIMGGATLLGLLMQRTGLLDTNIIIVYLFGILLLSMCTARRWVSAAAALISVLLFNFFFISPVYSLDVYASGYDVTFIFMLAFALIISAIINNERRQARESAKMVYRTELLLENSRRMRRAYSVKEVFVELSGQVLKLMNLPVVFYLCIDGQAKGPWLFPKEGMTKEELKEKAGGVQERAVAQWVVANRKRAGCCTHTLPMANAMYLPIQAENQIYAVMGILLEEKREIPAFEYGLLTAMLNEAALVFARIYLVNQEKK